MCSFPRRILRLAPPFKGSSETAEFMITTYMYIYIYIHQAKNIIHGADTAASERSSNESTIKRNSMPCSLHILSVDDISESNAE